MDAQSHGDYQKSDVDPIDAKQSVVCDDSSYPGIVPYNNLATKSADDTLSDTSLNANDGTDSSPLGLKISNVTSLKTCKDTAAAKPEVPPPSSKDENLQQLTTNALPPYSPPSLPESLRDSVPYETYSCSDCGDTFALKSNLTFHLHRKSVKITFLCDSCSDVQIFYNRCNLLSHIRAHSDKGEASDIRNAFIKPISVLEMQQEIPFPDEDDITPMDTSSASPTKLLEVSISEPNLEQPLVSSPEEDPNVACSECGKSFDDAKARIEHLTNNDKIPVVISQCQRCLILCPSRCNFQAHLRIHMKVKPFVCPECGVSVEEPWDTFFKHLKFECYHFSRSVGYKCSVCKRLVGSSVALQKHTMDLHTETYVKCQACPMAFKTATGFQNHKASVHSVVDVQQRMIFKCVFCVMVSLTREQMMAHLDFHIKDQVCQYVFNCMECNKAIDSKVALHEHLQIFHSKLLKTVSCSGCSVSGTGNSQEDKAEDGNDCLQPQKVQCILCHSTFMTRQGYSIHNTKAHTHSKRNCFVCGLTTECKNDMVEHGRRHLKRGSFICLLCHNHEFKDATNLAAHLLYHLYPVKFPSYCPLCDMPLFSTREALSHLKKEHGFKNTTDAFDSSESQSLQSVTPEIKLCHICKLTFVDWNKWRQHMIAEHKMKTESKDGVSLPVVMLTPMKPGTVRNANEFRKGKVDGLKEENTTRKNYSESKKISSSDYCCAKCDFSSEDKAVFRTHIADHKSVKSSFQCQDCGACFIVEPALKIHLKAIHKIEDVDKYISEEGTNYSPETETPSESSNHSSLECTVCYTTFPSEASLKTHLRSHGMAFIQAKKTSGSAK